MTVPLAASSVIVLSVSGYSCFDQSFPKLALGINFATYFCVDLDVVFCVDE